MRSTGVDDLKAALRRSLWLFILLPIIGAAAMTAVRQSQEPRYQATARVVLPQSELAATLAGIQPVYVDPDRRDDAEQNLAKARGLYARAARQVDGRLGTGPYLRSVTDADATNNLVAFSTTTNDRPEAIAIANAVAAAYPDWRAGVYLKTIDAAIAQIRAQLGSGRGSEALSEQLQRLNVLRTLNSGDTAIVEPTDGAAQTSPRLVRDAVLGGAIGFVVALLIAGLRELLDTRVRSEADVEEAIGVPVLGSIQTIPKRARSRAAMDPRFSDAYELLAANLAQILEGQERPTYVAVTSADPGEGKTTTSANLALALARRGQDVVLADFDLRKPQLGSLFAVPNDATGVADVLRGEAVLSSILWPIPLGAVGVTRARAPGTLRPGARAGVGVAPPGVDGEGSLLLLPAGHASSGGTGGSFSRLPRLLDSLESMAEYVIIDTPPALLTAGVAELAQSVNAVLVVVRQGTATRRRLRALGSRGHTWRSKIVGAVLNGTGADEGYSGYYGSR